MAKPLIDLPFPSLDQLIGSVSSARFFEESWERSPARFPARSPEDREGFRRPVWEDLAKAALKLDPASVEVIHEGRPGKARVEETIGAGFDQGASVRVIQVQRVWPFLDQLCRSLQRELGFKVGGNLYVTPEGRQGLEAHSDSHDVFVVQMAGRKDWEIWGSPYVLPVEYRAPMVFEEGRRRDHRGDGFGGRGYRGEDVGPSLLECSLDAGDLLYVPRGFVHQAVASHGTSVHVTIGIHATTWGDLLALAAAQESRTEASLRETVPPGATRVAPGRKFVEGELRRRGSRVLDRLHGDALFLETAARFAAASAGSESPGPATDSDQAAGPSASSEPHAEKSEAAFDPAARYRLAPDGYVSFGPREIDLRSLRRGAVQTLPLAFKPLVDSLIHGEDVCASAAPPLTQRSAEVLFARLVGAGILVPAN